MPSRSNLYSLKPIGVKTPYIESLTSYIMRLAEAHSVRTWKLIAYGLFSLSAKNLNFNINKFAANNGIGNFPDVSWSTTGHTGVEIPVYSWGVNAHLLAFAIENTDIFTVMDLSLSGG